VGLRFANPPTNLKNTNSVSSYARRSSSSNRQAPQSGPAHRWSRSRWRPRSTLCKGLAEKALPPLRDGGWLTGGALLVVEEAKAAAFAAPDGFEELERRAYDDTEFVVFEICRRISEA